MPIGISKREWERIVKWTDMDKEDPEVVRRREYVRYLDETSKAMAKDWPNSLENVNKRNEELRLARIQAAEDANNKFYKKYLKRQRQEQEKLMYSARDTIFKNKDAPKLLLSAVMETVIQKERQIQLEFNNRQREAREEERRSNDADIIRRAQEWEENNKRMKDMRFKVNKEHQKEILEQAHEISERNRKNYEEEMRMQRLDNLKSEQQMEAIKQFEDEFKAAEKARIWSDMERARQETEKRRSEQQARDKMDDQLIEVLQRSRARVDAKRRQTEKETKDEKNRMIENISSRLQSGDAARDAKEQQNLEKAIKEKEDKDNARREALRRKDEQIRQDRIAIQQKFLKDEEQRVHKLNTLRQWDIMNRFKNQEIYEDFKEHLREERARKIQEHRTDILRLWKERDDREAREKAETRYFYGELAEKKIRDADNKVLVHAAALIEEARQHGRPERPLLRAIDRYCKMYRLYPMPDLPKSLKEHFQKYSPWDGSKPDPWYAEPPKPEGPDDPDVEEHDEPEQQEQPAPGTSHTTTSQDAKTGQEVNVEKRYGLQSPEKAGQAKSPKGTTEACEDYKRTGRANGLQRRLADASCTLPPITVLPCTTEDCACDLKR